jgi:hypothetical protein
MGTDLLNGSDPHVAASHDFAAVLDALFDGLTITRDAKSRSSCACMRLAREHHFAIIKLAEVFAYASALALLRVQYVAFVRGTWIRDCATEAEVLKFEKGSCKDLGDMVIEVKRKTRSWADELEILHKKSVGGLSDYVHSGSRATSKQISLDSFEPTYSRSEVLEVCDSPMSSDFTRLWALFNFLRQLILNRG